MSAPRFLFRAIDPDTADRLRNEGGSVFVADEHPGYPCRQCLVDAQVGEELLLVSHDPFSTTSPYRSASPIFLHRERCAPHVPTAEVADQQRRRTLSVRGFDNAAMMLDAAVIDGAELHDTIVRLLGNPAIDRLHVHNAERGCWAVDVERA
jgi:hypothetical protein